MSKKILNEILDQHKSALRGFKEHYCFETKQKDILFRLECSLRKCLSEQLADQNRVAALTKKMEKRQKEIDKWNAYLEVTKTVTKEDVCIE